jgi:hypothetical protein
MMATTSQTATIPLESVLGLANDGPSLELYQYKPLIDPVNFDFLSLNLELKRMSCLAP